jgi:hypothetical protein
MDENTKSWKIYINRELSRAKQARREGNEGMARVCARRAAGIALKEFFNRHNVRPLSVTPYGYIEIFRELPETPARIKKIANHLTLRVMPDSSLPVEADLIQDAWQLIAYLFPGEDLFLEEK